MSTERIEALEEALRKVLDAEAALRRENGDSIITLVTDGKAHDSRLLARWIAAKSDARRILAEPAPETKETAAGEDRDDA